MSRLCLCFRAPVPDVRVLDYHHTSLINVPNEVFNWERTLEELYVDSNQIRDLPRVRIHWCGDLAIISFAKAFHATVVVSSAMVAVSSEIAAKRLQRYENSLRICQLYMKGFSEF